MYDVIHGVNGTGNVITRITFVETVTMFKLIRDKMDMCLANGLRFVCVCFCFSFTIFVSSSSCVYRYVWKKGSIKTLYINERLLVGRSITGTIHLQSWSHIAWNKCSELSVSRMHHIWLQRFISDIEYAPLCLYFKKMLWIGWRNLFRRLLSYKTGLDTKPVLYQDRFCSLTDVVPTVPMVLQQVCTLTTPVLGSSIHLTIDI